MGRQEEHRVGHRKRHDRTKIFVYNIDPKVDEQYVKLSGNKEVIEVVNTRKGFAFVTYATPEGVEKAIQCWDGEQLFGQQIKCELAKTPGRNEEQEEDTRGERLDSEYENDQLWGSEPMIEDERERVWVRD